MVHKIVLLCSLVAIGAAPLSAAPGSAAPISATQDWPQFRGPSGQGISTATDVPVEWNAQKNVAWSLDIPGRGWSSPVLAGGKVFLTTAVGGTGRLPLSLHVLCIDAQTGKGVWDTEVFQPNANAARQIHPKNSPASPTPLIVGDRMYVHFGHLGTAALDLSGKVLWKQTDLNYIPVHGNGGSPVLVNGLLIFNCDGARDPMVVALDAQTGQIKWHTLRNTTARKTFSFCTPLVIDVNGGTQVISPGSGFVGGYDPESGKELWRVRYGEGYSVVPRPVFADGLLFVSSGFDVPVLYAIKPDGASGDATASNVVWTARKGAPRTPSVVVSGDELYMIDDGGIASCTDARTGQVYWAHRLDGAYSASPVLAEGKVYFQTEDGVGTVVKAGKTYEQLSVNDLGERTLASYAVTDHALFIRTEKHLFKIASAAR
jgi:outer membrane protein assembly factor BamB